MEQVMTSTCQVAPDQRKSFMPKLAQFPVEVRVDATFSSDQQSVLRDAVDRWNRVGRDLMGQDFFAVRIVKLEDSVRSLNPNDCAQNYGSPGSFAVVREKTDAHWKSLGLNRSVPGATIRCSASVEVAQQIMWLYPEVAASEQFGTIVVHELGHVVGLDHSCQMEAVGSDRFLSCQGLASGHPYRQAVMYPSFHVTAPGVSALVDPPEIKNDLRSNDVLRAQCLYDSRAK
jgi:hypothetical protein